MSDTTPVQVGPSFPNGLDAHRYKVFMDRYALKDSNGQDVETSPEQMWHRVAKALAQIEYQNNPKLGELFMQHGRSDGEACRLHVEHIEKQFYQALKDFGFVPAGRILSSAGAKDENGNDIIVTSFNCFVIPQPEDSRGGIMDNVKLMIEIMARGGGVGVNLSSLRPRKSYIKSVNGRSSGPVNWGEMYSTATGKVIQQGGSRRGALMIMLDDDHPDIMEFITAKAIDPATNKPSNLEFANVSIAVSDAFMQAVKDDAIWQTQFPTKANIEAARKEAERTDTPFTEPAITYGVAYSAREIWDAICQAAWDSAEPGLVFMERYQQRSNTWYYENIRCVNPCGEQGLPEYGVCNLGAINLSKFVLPPSVLHNRSRPMFDYDGLALTTAVAMRMLDNVIDMNHYFLPENEEQQKGTRRTGLGTMGLADALIKLELPYGSPDATKTIEAIYRTIRNVAYETSARLAEEKGKFPKFDAKLYMRGAFIKELPGWLRNLIGQNGIRNAVLLTQAPTGTTSLLAGVSSGIEPVFAFAMERNDRTGKHTMYHPLLQAWIDDQRAKGSNLLNPPSWFVASGDLTPEAHVSVQATVQRYTDSSISKTVNGPNSHTVEDVKRLYMASFDEGCKGVTYYRDGSRDAVLTKIETKPESVETPEVRLKTPEESAEIAKPKTRIELPTQAIIKPRPITMRGRSRNIQAPEGKVNVTLNVDEDGPLEVIINLGKAGSDGAATAEALGRLISLELRTPSPLSQYERLEEVINQLRNIGGSGAVGFGMKRVRSLPDAVAQALTELNTHTQEDAALEALALAVRDGGAKSEPLPDEQPEGELVPELSGIKTLSGDLCPQCLSMTMVREEGCSKCQNPGCGYSAC